MSKLEDLSDKLLQLANQVGGNIRSAIPDQAPQWLQAGAVLGAAKASGKAAGGFAKRHPTALVVGALAAGAALYLVHRHRKKLQQADGVIEGKARLVEAKRGTRRRVSQAARNVEGD